MSLKQTIENEYKNALKSKDKNKISTYRLILSSIKDLDIVNRSGPNKKETDDEDIKKLLKKNCSKEKLFFYNFILHLGCDNKAIIVLTFNS